VSSRRLLKAAEAIREVVASAILTEIRDPRVKDVTVINVEVTPDMREAKVSVSVMGDETQKQLSLKGLRNSAGFLQSKIARRIDSRYTPKLRFELNRGIENAMVVGELLGKIRREREQSDEETGNEPPPAGEADTAAGSASEVASETGPESGRQAGDDLRPDGARSPKDASESS
jgi:ribosome-binding factor A